MNLDNVLPLPLGCSDYVTTSAKLILDNDDITQKQLLKQMQNVCIVYACLAVKRNAAGIVGTDAKHAAAATGYKEIAVPGFLRWARDEGLKLPTWLTVDRMGCTTLVGAPILFTEGKKLWIRFDAAMREMKRDYNKIWDRYVKGQPGGNLPSGQNGDDAIDNLLEWLYARNAGSAESPVQEEDLVEAPSSGGG
ncbi:unnamed protein product, partial [Pylaiella littoralis]